MNEVSQHENSKFVVGVPGSVGNSSHIRLLLVDDHTVMRAGTRRILEDEPDFTVVGEAGDGDEALRLADEVDADIMLLDVSMPTLDGVNACRQLRVQHPQLRICVLTGYDSDTFVRALDRLGVDGYLLKSAGPDELVSAIRGVASGERVFCEPAIRVLEGADADEGVAPTAKELAVLHAVAQGMRNRDIAQELNMSVNTVEFHLKNLFTKLRATSRADALVRAQRRGWLDMTESLC
ncbi:MAG TPA: response regulator transcription factor [Ktedonobacterales bacterium]|jgi:DNA-binding NarL/FixJ family response regulator|nr:response regulator transcription factor [Ktedonobacterales bacterium]